MADILVSPDWLSERLGEVRILDVRGEVAATEPRYRSYPEAYRDGHVPGAVFCDWQVDFTDRTAEIAVTIAPPEVFAADAARLGIGCGSTVVAYDDYHSVLASRIVWVLRGAGVDARILDGGLTAWAHGRPLEQGDVVPDPPAELLSVEHIDGLIDIDAVRAGLPQLVDARSTAQYTGADTHARRAGHIPGAVSMPYTELLGADDRFLPPDELRARLTGAGIDLEQPIAAYCNGGVSATVVAHAVELAGAPRPVVYDGSWNEWGNRDDTPVETGV